MDTPSRKRRRPLVGDAAFAPREVPAAPAPRPRRLRGAAADDAARAALEPLAPGERPAAVTVAAVVALLAAAGNLLALALAADPTAARTRYTLLEAALLVLAAGGMWRVRYWAVLGFQVLLAITCVVGAGMLALAGNAAAVLFGLLLLAGAGTLFWFLVRAMARIQLTRRPPP